MILDILTQSGWLEFYYIHLKYYSPSNPFVVPLGLDSPLPFFVYVSVAAVLCDGVIEPFCLSKPL